MKKIVTLAFLTILLAACANQNTVNILISKTNDHDTTNVVVHVPIEKVITHINTSSVDSLIILNEKNQRVDFLITHGNQDIEFIVPIVKARSQKNYSINTAHTELGDNIFSFRTASITVNL